MERKTTLIFLVMLISVLGIFSIYTLLTNTGEKHVSLDDKLEFRSWTYNGTSWNPESTAPSCPEFKFAKLFDTNSLDSLSLPGYFVSEEYLPYSKLTFTSKDIDIYVPIDTYLVQAGSYFDGAGDIQYRLNFLHPCGILLQYNHLASISSEIKPTFDKLPKPLFQSKAFYEVEPVFIPSNSKIATKIGIYSQNNFFFSLQCMI